ncbi:MAG TPA: HD domain-containing protein [Candidatus Saccharimonadales bacterium]|nr:HD domain-containing protein [Candidatus Saccharimonadales bacterium]
MKRDLEFLYEIGALRLIPRQWSRFHLPNVQNLSEHHFRVIWLALMIAAREGQGDSEKIMKMALVHDIAESRTGDVDYIGRQYVERHEHKALEHMLSGTPLKDEFLKLFKEYEERTSIESQIVKDADNLDVDMDLREQGASGHNLGQDWKGQRAWVGNTKLYTKTAKQLHKAIWSSNPHDWHIKSPFNRLNGGDWKKKGKA